MSYTTVKWIKGHPYLYLVRSERDGDRVRQVFVKYLGRADKVSRDVVDREVEYQNALDEVLEREETITEPSVPIAEERVEEPEPEKFEEITPVPTTPTEAEEKPEEKEIEPEEITEEGIDKPPAPTYTVYEGGEEMPTETLEKPQEIPTEPSGVIEKPEEELPQKGEFVRVTYRVPETGKTKSIWAIVDARSDLMNMYIPVNKEGVDLSREAKEGEVLPKELIDKNLIIKEEPAHIDRMYGTMKIGKLPPPPSEPSGVIEKPQEETPEETLDKTLREFEETQKAKIPTREEYIETKLREYKSSLEGSGFAFNEKEQRDILEKEYNEKYPPVSAPSEVKPEEKGTRKLSKNERYSYTIYKPDYSEWEENSEGEPYKETTTTQDFAKAKSQLEEGDYLRITLEEKVIGSDEYGKYTNWETIGSATIDQDEIGDNDPDALFKQYGSMWD